MNIKEFMRHKITGTSLLASAAVIMIMLGAGDLGYVGAKASAKINCSSSWSRSSDAQVRDYCARLKEEQHASQEQQTSHQKRQEPYYQTRSGLVLAAQLPQPEDTKMIQQLTVQKDITDPDMRQLDGPPILVNADSAWLAGSVPSSGYLLWDPLYVVTTPGNGAQYRQRNGTYRVNNQNPSISTLVMNADQSEAKYQVSWTCPEPLQSLYITRIEAGAAPGLVADLPNFMGLNYKVYFSTTKGSAETGVFDMATQQWSIQHP